MLIKAVPYYPVNMRQTHRIIHHQYVASDISNAVTRVVTVVR